MGNRKDELNASAPPTSQTLRQRAEEALQRRPILNNLTPEEEQALLHELRVHQIELEMQNEQLRQTQEQLELSRDRYLNLYDFAPVGYLTVGENGLILEANFTSMAMLGVDRSDLVSKPLTRFIFPKDQDIYYQCRREIWGTSEPQAIELRMQKQGSPCFYVRMEASLVQDYADNTVCRVAVSDVSQRVRAEEQKDAAMEELQKLNDQLAETLEALQQAQEKLMQQERLAVVGQLSAGIAHDFNNILTVILSYSELMQLSRDTPEAMQSNLKKVSIASRRAAHLVRQLLDFSRKSIRQLQVLDLASLAVESSNFLERTISGNIQVSLKVVPGDYRVYADPTQLQQVIINLGVNARDAMLNGGNLKIGLSRVEIVAEEYCVTCGHSLQGKWVCLTVADTGGGIHPSIMPHIFEPFFTTKTKDVGTGLGLSQVYGIVKQHAGHIIVSSQMDQGTTITVYLPPSPTLSNPSHSNPNPKATVLR